MDVDPLQTRRNHTAIDNKQIYVGSHTPTGCLFIYNESCNKLYGRLHTKNTLTKQKLLTTWMQIINVAFHAIIRNIEDIFCTL